MRRFFFVAALAAACARPAGRPDFVLRIAVVGPLEPLGPVVRFGYATAAAQDLVFQAFLAPDEHGNLFSPLGAWQRVDARRVRIRIDPALRFSDGSPVRAEDATRSLSAGGLTAREQGDWLEIEPADGQSAIEPLLLYSVLFKATADGPVGTGVFALDRQGPWRIALTRVRPVARRIGHVEIVAYPTPRDVLAHVIRGDANGTLGLDERQMELIEGIPALRTVHGPSPIAGSVIFKIERLSGAERRQIAAAVPVHEIAKLAFDARCAAPPEHRHAAALLSADRRIDLLTGPPNPSLERAALALRRSWGARGGAIVHVAPSDFVRRLQRRDFDVAVTTMLVWPPSSLAVLWGTGGAENLLHYSNAAVDAAFAAGDYARAEAELERDPPFVKLCRLERYAAFDARIRNPRLGWWGLLDLLPQWEVDP